MPKLSWAAVDTWLIEHDIPILIIVVVGAVLWFALNKFLPPIVRRLVARTGYKESEAAIEKFGPAPGVWAYYHKLHN